MTVTPLARDNERVPEIVMIPAGQLVADDNIRAKLGDLTELKASIKTEGILEPLLVSWIEPPDDGKHYEPGYRVAAGHRRLAAAVAVFGHDKTVVPCIVREMTEAQRLAVMLIENIHRADLTPVEEARAFARTIEAGMNKKELAKRLGVKEQLLTERIALLALPPDLLTELDKGVMTLASAGEYLKLVDHPRELKEMYKRYGANVRDSTVTDKLKSIERKAKADALETELTEKGKRVKRSVSSYSAPDGLTWLEKLGITGKEATKHARLKCHVVVIINEQYGTTISTKPACSAPSSHLEPEAKVQVTKQAVENAASGHVRRGLSPEEQAQRDAEAESEKRQLRFVGQWVSGLKRSDQAELVIDASVDRIHDDVAVALGLEDFPIDENGRIVWNEAQRFWAEAVSKSTIAKFRIVAVDAALQLLPGNYGDDAERLAWLIEKGYEPDEREAALITKAEEEKAKRRDRMAELPAPLQERLVKVHAWLKTQDKELRAEFAEAIAEQLKHSESVEDLVVAVDQVVTIWEEDSMPASDEENDDVGVYAGDEDNGDEITSGPPEDDEELDDHYDDDDVKYEGEGVESGQYD